ncbi:hypothetical protein HK105_201485 [Polyrhizophydium stewartii]|uniref:Uncharacterized protein n=1 Tax=Polyrhizophydium stewartii TaxID=2732419 RepID=A0ABR4NGK8_9FUNG
MTDNSTAVCFSADDIYMSTLYLGNNLALTATIFGPVCILVSSRHLYSKSLVAKLPFPIAATVLGGYVLNSMAWLFDVATRSILIWFTYFRLAAVWHEFKGLKYVAWLMQALQLVALGLAMYAQLPNSPVPASYLIMDIFTSTMDVMLLARLAIMRNRAQQTGRTSVVGQIKMIYFYKAVACMLVLISIPIVMTALYTSGNDSGWQFYVVLFSFRIILTDMFSNAMRDSLIEGRAESASKRRASTTVSRLTALRTVETRDD